MVADVQGLGVKVLGLDVKSLHITMNMWWIVA